MMRAAWVVAIVLGAVGVARAGGPSEEEQAAQLAAAQAKMRRLEQLERAAKESGDLALYEQCGAGYVEMVEVARVFGADRVPEMIYNAAVCFEEARSVAAALLLHERLLREYPRERVTQ